MTYLHNNTKNRSHTTELDIIKQKRTALQKLIKLTTTLNNLNLGLQSVIILGRSRSLSETIINKFHTLSDHLKTQSSHILKNTLHSTNREIERDMQHVMDISQKSNQALEKEFGSEHCNLVQILNEDYAETVSHFKKKSQTSIALNIALKSRHEAVESFKLPIPEATIREQIEILNQHEDQCLVVVKNDMQSFQQEIDNILEQDNYPEHVRDGLIDIKNELIMNAAHIGAGKDIEDLPYNFESIELSRESGQEEIETEADTAGEHCPSSEKPIKTGFFRRIWLWLNTSWKVKWRDIK